MTITEDIHREGHGILDSHVLDALPKARVNAEDKMLRDVARRREFELERRQRIFDAKRRTIGVDKEVLDAQMAEKERLREEAAKHRHDGDREALFIDRQLKKVEADKVRHHFELEKECRNYSLQNLSKEQSREWDLNDKLATRKGVPARIGDEDARCGPASMQKFSGEDLGRQERMRQQALQMRTIIEQQKFERSMLAEEKGSGPDMEIIEMIGVCNELDQQEQELRKELRRAQQHANLSRADQLKNQKEELKQNERDKEAAELQHHATDPWLNESTVDRLPNGFPRKAEYKGSTKDEKLQGRFILEEQARERDSHKDDQKADDKVYASQQESNRRLLIIAEREKARTRRAVAEGVAQENQKLRTQHYQKTKAMNELYTNRFADEFFTQFGTSSR